MDTNYCHFTNIVILTYSAPDMNHLLDFAAFHDLILYDIIQNNHFNS